VQFDLSFSRNTREASAPPPAPAVAEAPEPIAPQVAAAPREWKPVVSSPEPIFGPVEVLPPLPTLDFSAPVARRSAPEAVDMSEQAVAMRQVAALEQLLARVQARRGRRAVA
jgi:hypothetical protein